MSLQELGGIMSVYSDQEKLLRPPGHRRGPLLTADLLNTAEMASIVTILPPTVLTLKLLEVKLKITRCILVQFILTDKK